MFYSILPPVAVALVIQGLIPTPSSFATTHLNAGTAGADNLGMLDPTIIDSSVDPCQDFYQYACGNWKGVIPADKSQLSRSFDAIVDKNLDTLREILTHYSQGIQDPPTPYASKLGNYYASCLDEKGVAAKSGALLAERLAEVDLLTDREKLPEVVAKLHLAGVPAFFAFGPTSDIKDPTQMIAEIDQGGMSLPDSEYYTNLDVDSEAIRIKFRKHVAAMFTLSGFERADAVTFATEIYALENSLAISALPPSQLQNPTMTYHPVDLAGLKAEAPHFDWAAYFKALGIRAPAKINTTEPKFMAAFDSLTRQADLPRLRAYLKWLVIESNAQSLSPALAAEWFDFRKRTLAGQKEPAPRWQHCVNEVSSNMGEALGQAFVAKTFSPESKKRALEMILNIRAALRGDLENQPWLGEGSDPTRAAALQKLDLFSQKIGYPEHWRNYDALSISRGSLADNRLNSVIFETRRKLNQIGGKVDPSEWGMTPQTVNAYYSPSTNQINFPAAILVPPFFSGAAPDAWNYGAIGWVIGHESTHGFDTTGSCFDGHGLATDWWSDSVKESFDEKASCMKKQFSSYEVLPGVFVNGALTITENIADQGGLKIAYAAYQASRAGKSDEPTVAGMSADQQFFVSMGQIWCEKSTDAYAKELIAMDVHSPAKFRVNGTVSNHAGFAKAFGCAAGSPMAPKNNCAIW